MEVVRRCKRVVTMGLLCYRLHMHSIRRNEGVTMPTGCAHAWNVPCGSMGSAVAMVIGDMYV